MRNFSLSSFGILLIVHVYVNGGDVIDFLVTAKAKEKKTNLNLARGYFVLATSHCVYITFQTTCVIHFSHATIDVDI